MGGFLYPTLNTGNGGTSAVLGWQVQPFLNDNSTNVACGGAFANTCPTMAGAKIVREFCYGCGAGHDNAAYYGTIQPDPEGNFTMVFNDSNRNMAGNYNFHDGGLFLCQNTSQPPPFIQAVRLHPRHIVGETIRQRRSICLIQRESPW
jgi:hypothetical protein